MTNSHRTRDSRVVISSAMPSAKYSWLRSPPASENGNTTSDGLPPPSVVNAGVLALLCTFAANLAGARHGQDQARMFWIRLDLAPYARDEHVDAPVERLRFPSCRDREQLVTRQDAFGPVRQRPQ